jgi:hypothetical protein
MRHQHLISTALIVSGIILIFRASAWIIVTAHNHPPGESLYRSEMLERELQGDEEKLAQLVRDHKIAQQRVRGIVDYASTSMWWLVGCGVLNLYCGIVLRPSRRRIEADQVDASSGDKSPD